MPQPSNPLLESFDYVPFSKIKPEHFEPAIDQLIIEVKQNIEHITDQPTEPTFENTFVALEYAALKLEEVASILFNLNSAETSEAIQELAATQAPKLSELNVWIYQNKNLFDRISQICKSKTSLTPEQTMLLDKTYKHFIKTGINLPQNQQEEIKKIDTKLATLSVQFAEHVLKETNAYMLHITDQTKLEGLPESLLTAAKQEAEAQKLEGWVFTLQYPSYIPFMTYCQDRALRKEMAIAKGSLGFQNNEHNNEAIILETVRLRQQRAKILGYDSHAASTLEDRMLNTPDKVLNFLDDLYIKSKPFAEQEFKKLEHYAKQSDGIEKLQKWDTAYYTEQLKQEEIQFDQEKVRAYFPLERVQEGVFGLFTTLFDLSFEEDKAIDRYHDDVTVYRVLQQGRFKAILYLDLFPRAGKRSGAWMTSFKDQYRQNGIDHRPHISVVCNFTPPIGDKPSLLTPEEVTTLHHELGHALHGMLSDVTYPSLSGTSVAWDFVELPSQLMENWALEPEFITKVAKHYKTGETIPVGMIDTIKQSMLFMPGLQTLRQLSFGFIDMKWHHGDISDIQDVKTFEESVMAPMRFTDEPKNNCFSTAFSHIFAGGYSAGYYSYKWSEALDADAFDYFKAEGMYNTEISKKLETHILSKGGSEPPEVLYNRFRGRDVTTDALLKRYQFV